MAEKLPLGVSIEFESTVTDTSLCSMVPRGVGILVSPCTLLRMRIEKGAVPWSDLWLESKTQSSQMYDA